MNKQTNQTQPNTSSQTSVVPQIPTTPQPSTNPQADLKKEHVVATNLLDGSAGINLVPLMSKEEIVKEEKKQKLNMSSIIIIIILILITISVVGFNVVSRLELKSAKSKLAELEDEANTYSEKIKSNDEILDRVFLYKEIESKQFSSKAVVEYITDIAKKSGNVNLTSFDFIGKESIAFEGSTENLETASKFWYLLNGDANFENMEMESISKNPSEVRFSFEGKILVDRFLKSDDI